MASTLTALLVLSAALSFVTAVPAPAKAAPAIPSSIAAYSDVIDVGTKLRAEDPSTITIDQSSIDQAKADLAASGATAAGSGSAGTASYAGTGTQQFFLGLDDYYGRYRVKPFTLRAVGAHGEIWVANDLNFPTNDPRNPVVVTDEQISYLLDQYDKDMFPTEEQFFGQATVRDGSNAILPGFLGLPADYYKAADGSSRTMILIDNIRDDSYYNSSYPFYIAGFFSPSFSVYMDRNIISIDAYDWANRVGPNTSPWRGSDQTKWRPFLYEGTFAHEYQHLIHHDLDAAEENFVNEGMSDFAEFLTGYSNPNTDGHIRFFADHPENSLVAWGDQGDLEILGDYGIAYLFQLYLNEHFGGGPFIQSLARNQKQGIDGISATLAAFGYKKTFNDVYRDFSLALLADSSKVKAQKDKRYYFASVDPKLTLFNPDGTLNPEAYDFPGAPAWGADYLVLQQPKDLEDVRFNGVDFLPNPWKVVADPLDPTAKALWGGQGDLMDNFLVAPLDLTGKTTAGLSFDTLYDIEGAWDYGFVQVSTDGGKTWTSLANADTRSDVDPNGHPTVFANVPGFTGTSGMPPAWTHEAFDLTSYAGQRIYVAFRYVTDWGTNGNGILATPGWYLKNIALDGAVLADGSSTVGLMSLDQLNKNYVNYMVSFVGVRKDRNRDKYKIKTMPVFNVTQEDRRELEDIFHDEATDYVVMLVTYAAPAGATAYADYTLDVQRDDHGRHKGGENKGREKRD